MQRVKCSMCECRKTPSKRIGSCKARAL